MWKFLRYFFQKVANRVPKKTEANTKCSPLFFVKCISLLLTFLFVLLASKRKVAMEIGFNYKRGNHFWYYALFRSRWHVEVSKRNITKLNIWVFLIPQYHFIRGYICAKRKKRTQSVLWRNWQLRARARPVGDQASVRRRRNKENCDRRSKATNVSSRIAGAAALKAKLNIWVFLIPQYYFIRGYGGIGRRARFRF